LLLTGIPELLPPKWSLTGKICFIISFLIAFHIVIALPTIATAIVVALLRS
jgi:hypothetical protein